MGEEGREGEGVRKVFQIYPHTLSYAFIYLHIPSYTRIYLNKSDIMNTRANMRPKSGHNSGPRAFPKGENLTQSFLTCLQRLWYTQRGSELIKLRVLKGLGGSYRGIILLIGLPSGA